MMTDLLIYLIIIIASIFIGLFLGRNSARLKFQKEQATLEERNTILNKSIQDTSDDLKASQTEKEILIASKIRLETELKNSEKNIAENKEELEKLQEKFTKEFSK